MWRASTGPLGGSRWIRRPPRRRSAATATAVTDATGLFVLTGLPTGTYAVSPVSAAFAFSPASQSVSVNSGNGGGLVFQANPPIVPASYTLGPWTMIGAGVTATATV